MTKFTVPVVVVDSIEDHPTSSGLSVVKLAGHTVVTMKNEDGTFRFTNGEAVVYVPENAIVPDHLLQSTGFWDTEKNKGLLAGSKGNRVKGRKFGAVASEGLIWSASQQLPIYEARNGDLQDTEYVRTDVLVYNKEVPLVARIGDNVANFFGITEYAAK